MAESSREDKLAAARKKLKQFQKKKGPVSSGKSKKKKNALEDDLNNEQSLMNSSHVTNEFGLNSFNNESVYTTPPVTPSGHTAGRTAGHSAGNTARHAVGSGEPNAMNGVQELSREVNGLLNDESVNEERQEEDLNKSIQDLELRNRDLLDQLDRNSKANQKLARNVHELQSANSSMHEMYDNETGKLEEKQRKEYAALREQLQVHIQTIGILVAEKTELQSSLNQSQKMAQQRLEEIEELSGRLKASRQRVADVERNFTSASTSSQQHEKTSKEYSKDVDRLKLEMYKLNKSHEDLRQQNSEMQEKLHAKTSECSGYEQTVQDLKGKLEMSQVYIQQLSSQTEGSAGLQAMVEELQQDKKQLHSRVEQYNESFQKLTHERDQISEQYKSYIDQLQQEQQRLVAQIKVLNDDKQELVNKQGDLERSFTELETAKESQDADKDNTEESNKALQDTIEQLTGELETIKEAHRTLTSTYQTQATDNVQLSRLIGEKEQTILELETSISRTGEDSIDKEQLLETIQSDKTALSRAMAQNKALKEQLAELQNGFVKMTNENMELLTKVQSEEHVNKELAARLCHQEDELKDIREHLSTKEHELKQLKVSSTELNKQIYQQDQLSDRMRHYEVQSQLVDTLQRELGSSQDAINALTSQNTDLRSQLTHLEEATHNDSVDNEKYNDTVQSLSSSIQQLEMERNQLLESLEIRTLQHEEIKNHLLVVQKQQDNHTPATLNGNLVSKDQFESLKHAMEQIQDKYTDAMREKAELSDRNDQLEHLIMQLQSETDTIGEYVTIYQHQRQVMREKQQEKENYIQQLAYERETLKDKIGELQALVMQMLQERKQLHGYQEVAPGQIELANHIPHKTKMTPGAFSGSLDSTQLEDWPDYSSDGSNSDISEVEAIIGVGESGHDEPMSSSPPKYIEHSQTQPVPPTTSQNWNPPKDATAQKIMHLLTEIGNSNIVDQLSYDERNFLPCKCCKGKLSVV